jgi:hypothetical protein
MATHTYSQIDTAIENISGVAQKLGIINMETVKA